MAYPKLSFEQPNNVWGNATGREWDLSHILNQSMGLTRDQLGFSQGLEGQRQSSILDLIKGNSAGGRQAQVDAFHRQSTKRAKEQARNLNFLPQGLQQGAQLDLLNNAATSTNDFSAQLNSPESQAQLLQLIISAISSQPNMANTLNLAGPAGQTDLLAAARPQSQSGLGSFLQAFGGLGGGDWLGGQLFGRKK